MARAPVIGPWQRITNVNWGGGIWLLTYFYVSTANNGLQANGSGVVSVPGVGSGSLTSGISNNHFIDDDDIASGNFCVAAVFEQQLTDGFSSNIQGIRFIKLPPSGVIPGTVTAQAGDISSGEVQMRLSKTSDLKGKKVELRVDAVGIPVTGIPGTTVTTPQFTAQPEVSLSQSFQVNMATKKIILL